ncbi:MAG TPA: hypothetical protein VJ724_05005 [Tahibacter sp.]|nr:hypothetical protein [Tahibacter sp.]
MAAYHEFGFFDSFPPSQRREVLLACGFVALDEPERSLALSYLETGTPVMLIAGPTFDHLDDAGRIIGPPHVLTDGKLVWTRDVAFYLRHYDLTLPDVFLARMRELEWKQPSVNDDELEAVAHALMSRSLA